MKAKTQFLDTRETERDSLMGGLLLLVSKKCRGRGSTPLIEG